MRIARYIGNGQAICWLDGTMYEVDESDIALLRRNDPLAIDPSGRLMPVWHFCRIMPEAWDGEGYQEYLRSNHWRTTRHRVLDRYGCICSCGCKATHIHHLSYERLGHEWYCDLIPLCPSCHGRLHGL
jgi:hypothetical protein